MRIALAQLSATVGDFNHQLEKTQQAIELALEQQAQIIIFPELYLQGYLVYDMLWQPSYQAQHAKAMLDLAQLSQHYPIVMVMGAIDYVDACIYNAAHVFKDGICRAKYYKRHLPNTGVFDEQRYFTAGAPIQNQAIFKVDGHTFALAICEDIWHEPANLCTEKIDTLLVLNASPFELDAGQAIVQGIAKIDMQAVTLNEKNLLKSYSKNQAKDGENSTKGNTQNISLLNTQTISQAPEYMQQHQHKITHRLKHLHKHATAYNSQVVYVNLVGGQDECIFDGQSCIMQANGQLNFIAPAFKEGVYTINTAQKLPNFTAPQPNLQSQAVYYQQLFDAMVLGLKDYVQKSGFKQQEFRLVLGLSGGIDSALVACIAKATGYQLDVLFMPSKYTSSASQQDAINLANALNINLTTIYIDDLVSSYEQAFALFNSPTHSLTLENVQARIRGNLLMAYANQNYALLLTTGNKSELAMGYCTLYGDMAGAFNPIKDLYKTQVYSLCQQLGTINHAFIKHIPARILYRAPSAELKDGQTDQDSLPPYAILDAILYAYIEQNQSLETIEAMLKANDLDMALAKHIIKKLHQNEYKRQQAVLGCKLGLRAFGRDWRQLISKVN